jgi:hypothetical protein
LVCTSYSNTATAPLIAAINVKENFPTAFKGAGTAAANNTPGSEFTNNTETGFGGLGTANSPTLANTANTATMLQVAFNNISTGVTVYVPAVLSDINGSGSTLTLVSSPSSLTAIAASTSGSAQPGTAALTATNGTATAYYLYAPGNGTPANNAAPSNTTTDSFSIGIYGNSSANTVAPTSTALTAAVSFAPVGTTQIPNFVVGPSTTTLTLNTFSSCTTSLLFPFVTNQLGFDTGIAISNTSTDPFGTKGATPQSGTCTMNFYGNGAPSPANVATGTVASGTTYTAVLSSVAAGFQGYIIAQCNFQYAHGFAFITTGLGGPNGIAEGYLAGVIPDVNQVSRNAGVGEGLLN